MRSAFLLGALGVACGLQHHVSRPSRRHAVAALLGAAAVPRAAEAGLLGGGPEGLLGDLRAVGERLGDLTEQLSSGALRATEEDASTMLRTSAIYLKGTPALMGRAAEKMPALDSAKLEAFGSGFAAQVIALEEAARGRDPSSAEAASRKASAVLAEYLELASTRYTVPSNVSRKSSRTRPAHRPRCSPRG